jgi:hypothetical protein
MQPLTDMFAYVYCMILHNTYHEQQQLYTLVQVVEVDTFKGLQSETVETA